MHGKQLKHKNLCAGVQSADQTILFKIFFLVIEAKYLPRPKKLNFILKGFWTKY